MSRAGGTDVYGVTMIEGADRAKLVAVLSEDYRYLQEAYPDFVEGTVLASTVDPTVFFHITRWADAEAFSTARQDPRVHEILGGLDGEVRLTSHVCAPLVIAERGAGLWSGTGDSP